MNCILNRFKPDKVFADFDIKKAHESNDTTEKLLAEIQRVNAKNLSKERFAHTQRVMDTAVSMAKRYGADVNIVKIAAAFHDMAKGLSQEENNRAAELLGLETKYAENKELGHAKIAAEIAGRYWGIQDERILNAISYHTTSRADMCLEEKIVFLADLLEPARNYPKIDEIRRILDREGVDAACLEALRGIFVHIKKLDANTKIDDDGLRAYEWFRNIR